MVLEEDEYVIIPNEAASGANQKEVVVDMGNLKLRMYQGDITLADVDAIVNGTDSEMDLSKGDKYIHVYMEYKYVYMYTCIYIYLHVLHDL